ncbi:hypothetical protein L2Y90_33880 (plasmid) [Burkholderia pyrrocinia]|uniref:hypothetical protein n=1 Tax=Burkholderia pyrrocinia TaxID=60550 RepID=UPI00215B69DC|nr:hypothetical protein [Burkholderia pyrrocinia]UVE70111.1 hypothetical protein L2Y90_33880 [Burkholderia pyrrocinia]
MPQLFPRQDRSGKTYPRWAVEETTTRYFDVELRDDARVPHAGTRPGILNVVCSDSGQVAVDLRMPKAPGVPGDGVNPAQPFAAEYVGGTDWHSDSRHVGGKRNRARHDSIDARSC